MPDQCEGEWSTGCSITSAATVSTTGATGCFTFGSAFFTGAFQEHLAGMSKLEPHEWSFIKASFELAERDPQ
jgi:hypothetical protein